MYITEFLSLTQLVIREKKSYASEDTMTIQAVLLLSKISDILLFKQ